MGLLLANVLTMLAHMVQTMRKRVLLRVSGQCMWLSSAELIGRVQTPVATGAAKCQAQESELSAYACCPLAAAGTKFAPASTHICASFVDEDQASLAVL